MKHFIASQLITLTFALPAVAQQKAEEHTAHHPAASASSATGGVADMTEGEVRKVDKEAKKITLKHGDIKNLDMPGMTMVFQVKDAALLDRVKAGDKVMFTAEKADGAIVVTDLVPAR